MQVSQAGIDLIKNWEGYRSHAYPDPGSGAEPYTIGYGTTVYPTGEKVRLGDTCTEEQALEWLRYDVSEFEEAVNESLTAIVNQQMFDALVSLCYNIGAGAFKRSTLVKKLNEGLYLEAAEEFDRWNRASGREMAGLTRRRDAEQAMFNAGMDQALAFARDQTGFA